MRILHVSPFNTITKSGGALHANPIKFSLGWGENGHFVHNFDYRDVARHFGLFRSKKSGAKKMNEHLEKMIEALAPDLVVFGHAEMIERFIFERLKSKNVPMMFWYNDLPFPKNWDEIKGYFDVCFATAGGIDGVHYVPNPVHADIERYSAWANKDFANNIIIPARMGNDRASLVEFVQRNFEGVELLGYDKKSVKVGEAYLQKLISAKIAINHNRDFTLKYPMYSSDRLVHLLGNGVFTLSTPIVDVGRVFEGLLCYETLEDLGDKCRFYLGNEALRVQNARKMQELVHRKFGAKKVAKYMLDVLHVNDLSGYEWA